MFANEKKRQLYADEAETTIGTAADRNDVVTIETVVRAPIEEKLSQPLSNDGYDLESEAEDNGEVVPTPL